MTNVLIQRFARATLTLWKSLASSLIPWRQRI